jgi:hypothetical protein
VKATVGHPITPTKAAVRRLLHKRVRRQARLQSRQTILGQALFKPIYPAPEMPSVSIY